MRLGLPRIALEGLSPMSAGGFPGGGGGGDPDFASVRLLMHMEGASFVDSSSYANTLTPQANGVTSTAQFKFGLRAGDFTDAANNARVETASTTALALAGQFCIEFFVRFTSVAGTFYFLSDNGTGGSYTWFNIAASKIAARPLGTGAITTTTTVVANQWYHVRLNRDASNIVRMFLDGNVEVTTGAVSINNAVPRHWLIGSLPSLNGAGSGGRCYLDELRITIGASRDTTNFTPPTAPYSDS